MQELFIVAGLALFDAITDLSSVRVKKIKRIKVTAPDREALLVNWLSELNFYCITGLEVFNKFEIDSVSETHLSALVGGEKIDLKRHEIKTEIKAITYHGLYVRQQPEGWSAQVIFDV